MNGFVALVGAGPGDADLLTRKAEKLLNRADIVLHDRLVSDEVLALIPRGTPKIFAGKSCKIHYMTQIETNAALIELARQGKFVVRLKGGDPFIFGRGGEEAQALAKADIPFEVVPGITAAMGCAASSGIPLTHRDYCHSVRAITGHLNHNQAYEIDWQGLANDKTTLTVYMGLANAPLIRERLMNAGRSADTPVAAIMNGTLKTQKTVITNLKNMVSDIQSAGLKSPTLLIIGEVVNIATELNLIPLIHLSDHALENIYLPTEARLSER